MNTYQMIRILAVAAAIVFVLNCATACGSSTPLEPSLPEQTLEAAVETTGAHYVAGIWDFVIVPEVGIVDAVPRRTAEGHYDITKLALNGAQCPGCIKFQFGAIQNGGQQNVVVTLTNSYVGKIAGYDLKGIILADTSNDPTPPYKSPWYLLNPDDYTNLGTTPIYSSTRNPFKAFKPNDPQRKLGVGQASTLTYQLMFPPAPVDWSVVSVAWALDACEANCPEPYAIENQSVSGGTVPILGQTAQVSLNARDHQSNTASVKIDSSPIGGGAVSLTQGSGDQWSGNLSASDSTSPGEYTLEITATDSVEKAVKIFDYLKVTVGLTAAQQALYTKTVGIINDWDPDLEDCVIDELADELGTTASNIEDLITDFISDVEDLLDGPDTGAALKWKVLRTLKELVSDLKDVGVDTTMSDLIDALRDALDSCLNGSQGWGGTNHGLPGGSCTLDFGVIGGGSMAGQVLYTGNSPNCSHIRKYAADYSSNSLYKSLVNLDPAVANFQPWPVERLDAANDGAFSWTNDNPDYYDVIEYGFLPIRISSIWCTCDNNKTFHNIPVDDSRIFPVPPPPPMSQFRPADVCDDFDKLQYALVVDPTMIVQPHVWGLKGAPQSKDYTKSDDRYGAFFPWAMVGPGDGQIEPYWEEIAGIDAYGTSSTKARLFVAENGGQWALECFELTDLGAGLGTDSIAPVYTVHFDTRPLDVELLPTNPSYEANPNCPTVAVLLSSNDGTGYVKLLKATDGSVVDSIGSAQNGAVDNPAVYLDVNDGTCEIHVMQTGPQVTIFDLTFIPG